MKRRRIRCRHPCILKTRHRRIAMAHLCQALRLRFRLGKAVEIDDAAGLLIAERAARRALDL